LVKGPRERGATSFLIEAVFVDVDAPEWKRFIPQVWGRRCSASGYHRQLIRTGALRVREYIARTDRWGELGKKDQQSDGFSCGRHLERRSVVVHRRAMVIVESDRRIDLQIRNAMAMRSMRSVLCNVLWQDERRLVLRLSCTNLQWALSRLKRSCSR
jgi:hypothetical protein